MSEQTTTLGQLAQLVGGHVEGDPGTVITAAAVLSEVGPGEITFVDHPERVKVLAATQAAAALIGNGIQCNWPALIRVANVPGAFARVIAHFRPPRHRAPVGISPHAIVSPSARCGKNVSIYPRATVGDDCVIGDGATILPGAQVLAGCVIGHDVTIGPNAVLYENTIIGDRSNIQGGAIIGAHGFGYSQADGKHILSAQLGYVKIGCDVDVGAASTIDRGTYGPTTIGDGTKIDNLVQVAHNCRIGRHNLICAQVGIAGSSITGDYVVIGGQAGLRDHVRIGTGARLSAKAGIVNDVPDGVVMLGIPATPERDQKLQLAALSKLPEMRKEFKEMRRTIAALQNSANPPSQQKSDQAA